MNINVETFWRNVVRSDGCWEYTKRIHTSGYGRISTIGGHRYRKTVFAHRASWVINVGPIPNGFFVCHICDNRKCVRPDHLFLGSAFENTHDMIRKGRQASGDAVSNPGESNPSSKITLLEVEEIRKEYSKGERSQQQLADYFGVNQQSISNIVRKQTWNKTKRGK